MVTATASTDRSATTTIVYVGRGTATPPLERPTTPTLWKLPSVEPDRIVEPQPGDSSSPASMGPGDEWIRPFLWSLRELADKRYGLLKPMELRIEAYHGEVLISDGIVNRHGVGRTREEALAHYQEILVGYFETLGQKREKLSPRLKKHLEYLSDVIQRIT